ncbi:hypothetical protein, partial [Clostridium sp.]|uniref:hypothetical protein n=1 Tax=Clostridium sp. TaxID=1506 RepID=UPI002841D474
KYEIVKREQCHAITQRRDRPNEPHQHGKRCKHYTLRGIYCQENPDKRKQKNQNYHRKNQDKFTCIYCQYRTHNLNKLKRHTSTKKHEKNLLRHIKNWLIVHQKI